MAAAAIQTRPAPVRPAPPKATGACEAVTAADLQLALGVPFARGQETAVGAQSTCDYGAGNAQVSITVQRLSAKVDIAVEIEALKRELPECVIRTAGPAEFFLEFPGAGAQFHVIRGDRDYVMVSILGLGEPAAVSSAAERLARTALTRL